MNKAHGLRLVSRTREESAAILTATPADIAKAASGHASWKFRLLETVNADPLTDAFCLAVVAAYLQFTNHKSRSAYLSENDLQVRTGLSPRVLRKAKAKLVRLGYLTAEGRTKDAVLVYGLDNPRQELVAEHVVFARETMRDQEAAKKERERLRRRLRAFGGSRSAPPINGEGEADQHLTGGADQPPNTVEHTVERILYDGSEFTGARAWGDIAGEADGWARELVASIGKSGEDLA